MFVFSICPPSSAFCTRVTLHVSRCFLDTHTERSVVFFVCFIRGVWSLSCTLSEMYVWKHDWKPAVWVAWTLTVVFVSLGFRLSNKHVQYDVKSMKRIKQNALFKCTVTYDWIIQLKNVLKTTGPLSFLQSIYCEFSVLHLRLSLKFICCGLFRQTDKCLFNLMVKQ